MHLYLATSSFLLRSLRARLILLCLIATHLPLLVYIGWGLATGRIAMAAFAFIAMATFLGTAIALLGIGALLNPLHRLADMPRQHRKPASGRTAPRGGPDTSNTAARDEPPPTGIASRRDFPARLDALPDDCRHGCVAIVDIDHVARIADQPAGRAAVRAFAARLSAQLRGVDRVARWDDATFALFFPDCIEDEASWTLARIADRLRADPIGEVDGRRISFSAGLCAWTGGPAATPLALAEEALHDARRAGCDRICRAARHPPLPA